MRILAPSTEAQGVLRIMDDRPLQGMLTTGSRNGLGKTRFGGFFYARISSVGAV
jgi:hypothetical protein